MARHLTPQQVEQALRARRAVEQWLGSGLADGQRTLAWLRVEPEHDDRHSVTVFVVFDDGGPDFLDLYEFTPVDADKPNGETATFSTVQDALRFACSTCGAHPARFVGDGCIQDEYADFRSGLARPTPA